MVQINFARKAVTCKVVFYGPARAGKTANLRVIHDHTPEKVRGRLTSMSTDGERTLFFDFLPLDLGEVAGIRTKLHLYSVPYIDNQNALRLLVLEGADGIVFVADRSPDRLEANREALANLRENLAELGRELEDVPLVWEWNKSDHAEAMAVETLESEFNLLGRPSVAATAKGGHGVMTAIKHVSGQVLSDVVTKLGIAKPQRKTPAGTRSVEARREPGGVTAVRQRETEPATPVRAVAAYAGIGGAHRDSGVPATVGETDDERAPVGVPAWRRTPDEEDGALSRTPFFGVEPPRIHQEQSEALPPPAEPLIAAQDDFVPAFSEDDPPTDPEPELHLAPAPTIQPPGWFDEVDGEPEPEPEPEPESEPEPRFPLPVSRPDAPAAPRWKPPAPVAHQPSRRPQRTPASSRPRAEAPGHDDWGGYRPPPPSRGHHDPRPVVDRRRRPRAIEEQISDRAFWTGAAMGLVSLIAIGYVVHAFL